MSEKLCLQWNDFQDNIKSAFGNLREDKDFTDVTLVCEDGQQVEAHKVILAASSPLLKKLLSKNQHPHPLIYMRGTKFDDIFAIMDFFYRGEANVFQENLDSFLAIAEELQLEGLMGNRDQSVDNLETGEKCPPPHVSSLIEAGTVVPETYKKETFNNKIVRAGENTKVTIATNQSSDLAELDEIVKSMMEKSENKCGNPNDNRKADRCKVCGKEGKGRDIKDHIEANHIDGVALPCNICEKTFRSRHSLRVHHSRHKCTRL